MNFDNKYRSSALPAAVQIGDRIIEKSENLRNYKSSDYFCIASGVCGHILFLVELFRQTEDNKYWEFAEKSIKKVLEESDKNSLNYGFYTGRIGISYTLIKMYQVSGEGFYLEMALEVAKDALLRYAAAENKNNSVEKGRAGVVFVLLQLYSIKETSWLKKNISSIINEIIEDAHLSESGLCWEDSNKNIKGTFNLLHGASGIGLVFLEFEKCTNNDVFKFLAKQILEYGKRCWDPSLSNWADYRKAIENENDHSIHRLNYINKNSQFFTSHSDNTSWGCGTAGNGLFLLKACQMSDEQEYKQSIEAVVGKLSKIESRNTDLNCSLQDSSLGAALYFIESYKVLRDIQYLDLAYKAINTAISFSNIVLSRNSSLSLFSGLSGIGYLFLLISEPARIESIFSLSTTGKEGGDKGLIDVSVSQIREKLLKKSFPNTIKILKAIEPSHHALFLDKRNYANEFLSFKSFVINYIEHGKHKNLIDLKDAFLYELHKYEKCKRIKSNALLYAKDICDIEKVEALFSLEEKEIVEASLALSEEVQIITTRRDWTAFKLLENEKVQDFLNEPVEKNRCAILIQARTSYKIVEWLLEELKFVLERFRTPIKIKDAITQIITFCRQQDLDFFKDQLGYFSELNEDFFLMLEKKIFSSITDLINKQILKPVSIF